MVSWAIAALAGAAQVTSDDPALTRMVALYDEVCLQAFPIDTAVDAAMAARKAKALTPDEVKVTLRDDPGRGWLIEDGDQMVQVTLELPPYHACSVRRMTSNGLADPSAYRRVADAFERDHRGFVPIAPSDLDQGELHIHAVGEQRPLPGGAMESLFVFDQHIIDPAKRAAGQTAVNVRLVHQITAVGAQ